MWSQNRCRIVYFRIKKETWTWSAHYATYRTVRGWFILQTSGRGWNWLWDFVPTAGEEKRKVDIPTEWLPTVQVPYHYCPQSSKTLLLSPLFWFPFGGRVGEERMPSKKKKRFAMGCLAPRLIVMPVQYSMASQDCLEGPTTNSDHIFFFLYGHSCLSWQCLFGSQRIYQPGRWMVLGREATGRVRKRKDYDWRLTTSWRGLNLARNAIHQQSMREKPMHVTGEFRFIKQVSPHRKESMHVDSSSNR